VRAVVQRVSSASVSVDNKRVAATGQGLLVLLAVNNLDTSSEAQWLAGKISRLRIFSDDEGRMNNSVVDIEGEILVVSQFTIYGNCRKGNRPSFSESAAPEIAEPLYKEFSNLLREQGIKVDTGIFGAHMKVELCNDGPVTLVIDTP
jgi:D-tyrosyl-tRNA(Tyr) deacylase